MIGRLVFDGDCGFCTRSAGWLRRLDRSHRIDMRPLQRSGAPEWVGATRAECLDSVRWLGADGHRRSGAEAISAALGAALGTSLPLALHRVSAGPQERIYDWVAANRSRLPGATPHCHAHPADCDEHQSGPPAGDRSR